MIPRFPDNQLGGEVVSLTRQSRFILRNIFWHSFLLEAE
jgi:hypothetical protein